MGGGGGHDTSHMTTARATEMVCVRSGVQTHSKMAYGICYVPQILATRGIDFTASLQQLSGRRNNVAKHLKNHILLQVL